VVPIAILWLALGAYMGGYVCFSIVFCIYLILLGL
jgi:hypothetical protein